MAYMEFMFKRFNKMSHPLLLKKWLDVLREEAMEKEWKFAETVIILGTNFLLFYFILHSFFLIEKNRQFQRFTVLRLNIY